jgi:hypothetical protein
MFARVGGERVVDSLHKLPLLRCIPSNNLRPGGCGESPIDLVDDSLVVGVRPPIVIGHRAVVVIDRFAVLSLHTAVVRVDLAVVGINLSSQLALRLLLRRAKPTSEILFGPLLCGPHPPVELARAD